MKKKKKPEQKPNSYNTMTVWLKKGACLIYGTDENRYCTILDYKHKDVKWIKIVWRDR